ncbi:hypothetical protein ACVXHB_24595 [Escherichia coli]
MIFSDWPWRHRRQVREKPSPYVLMTSNYWRELCARVDELASGSRCRGWLRAAADVAGVEHAANAARLAGVTAMRGAGVAREPSAAATVALKNCCPI